jgi:predicted dehydrogenase
LALDDYRRMLELDGVDMVDVCTPNATHQEIVLEAVRAGQHVVCTKPLTGYFGVPGDPDDLRRVPKAQMLERAAAAAKQMADAAAERGVWLCYAENWVYAPSIRKAERLVEASGGAILEMRGGECHSGSHSPYSGRWRESGGGALLRLGSHPAGAALHLKAAEGRRRSGRPILPASVIADTGALPATAPAERTTAGWLPSGASTEKDTEAWGTILLTFNDGAKAVLSGSDLQLGGLASSLAISLSNARIICRLSPTDLCQVYAPDASVLGDEYLVEKLSTPAGWNPAAPDEDWTHGHVAMVQDFVEAVATGRPPLSDGELGRQVVEVIYAAYVSAEEGRRVDLDLTAG